MPLPKKPTPEVSVPQVILFDLDGTLTCPLLNFEAIRRDAGIASGRPILEAMAEMSEGEQERVKVVLDRHETDAARAATLNRGCHELLARVREMGISTAIITRNSLASTRIVLETHRLEFPVLITREDEPYKPRPEPLFLALKRLGREHDRDRAWMVGDGVHDIEAGNAAGVKTIWISHGKQRPFSAEPWLEVANLPEITVLLAR